MDEFEIFVKEYEEEK